MRNLCTDGGGGGEREMGMVKDQTVASGSKVTASTVPSWTANSLYSLRAVSVLRAVTGILHGINEARRFIILNSLIIIIYLLNFI